MNRRKIANVSVFALAAILAAGGLLVAVAATGIGLIPVAFGCRKTNCMGVLLLPITLNMAGVGAGVAQVLGLM